MASLFRRVHGNTFSTDNLCKPALTLLREYISTSLEPRIYFQCVIDTLHIWNKQRIFYIRKRVLANLLEIVLWTIKWNDVWDLRYIVHLQLFCKCRRLLQPDWLNRNIYLYIRYRLSKLFSYDKRWNVILNLDSLFQHNRTQSVDH